MFGRIRSLFSCFWKYDQNPKVLKDSIRKPMCIKIGPEFQFSKDKMRIAMCLKIGPEFQC